METIKNAELYVICPRCGGELIEEFIYEDHCIGCKETPFDLVEALYGNELGTSIKDTGYIPPRPKI